MLARCHRTEPLSKQGPGHRSTEQAASTARAAGKGPGPALTWALGAAAPQRLLSRSTRPTAAAMPAATLPRPQREGEAAARGPSVTGSGATDWQLG